MTHLMKRAGAVALVGLVIGAAGQARADLITYKIQSYSQYQNGYSISGTISVDSAYLGTITNQTSLALSWSYSIYDSTGAFVGAASSTDFPNIGGDLQNGGFLIATTTELILPAGTPNFTLNGIGEWIGWRSYGAGEFGFFGELPGQTIWNELAVPIPNADTGLVIGVASAANTYKIEAMFDQSQPHQSGSTIPIKIEVTDAQGNNVGSSSLPVTAVSVVGPDGTSVSLQSPGNSQPGNMFVLGPGTHTFMFNVRTNGYGSGTYILLFRVGVDPTLYSVTFVIR
jgi:hypothetical protein